MLIEFQYNLFSANMHKELTFFTLVATIAAHARGKADNQLQKARELKKKEKRERKLTGGTKKRAL